MKLPPMTLRTPVATGYDQNLVGDAYHQTFGKRLAVDVPISGNNETVTVILFKFTGSLAVLNQWGQITEITDISNCTNVYADVYDGTTAVNLTNPGVDISGYALGSMIFKDEIAASTFSTVQANQVRVYENRDDDVIGRPFNLIGKDGVDNYIRIHLTTTGILDFKVNINIRVALVNGSTFELNT
jgi:hypothetical protein